ncbi:leucine-rich repeat-containing protein 37B-like isoform X2 [Narcine bancroftii]|uniref:leucine-rich repeat-containing protein 37B-like isoform X2 n=1 Tax=Narcine bancroftii TaxID=1343680 RepID=UPI00383123DD
MAGGFGLASLVASCLLALSARSDSRRATVALPRNGPAGPEPRAVCPARCRCYLNILSCHPQKPLEPPDGAWNRTADTLTRVPKGTRGTVSGHVLTPFSVLDFRDNNISFIWKDSWLAYPSTEYLFLSYNSIRFIADYMFQPTPEIELIDISNNKLFAVQSNLFRTKHGLRFLKVLDLSNNNILVLGPGAFSQLSNLHFLNISDNYLSLIGNGAFDHLNSVIYLDLRATSISLDVLKSILESTTNIVNLYISHTLRCCLCKFPNLNKLILTRNVEINCKNIFCTVSQIQCYTKEVKHINVLKDKERIIEEMEGVKAGTVLTLPGRKHSEEAPNKITKLERSRSTGDVGLNSFLSKDLKSGDKQGKLKEELINKNTKLKDKIKNEELARDTDREKLKQINMAKLSSKSERPALPDEGNEENT